MTRGKGDGRGDCGDWGETGETGGSDPPPPGSIVGGREENPDTSKMGMCVRQVV